MNTFDLFIFIPIALGLIFGFFKGFVKEAVSLAAVVLAIFAAEMLNGQVAVVIGSWFGLSGKMGTTVSYTLIFVVVLLVSLVISNAIHKLLCSLNLGWLNSLLGGLFGAVKYAVIVSVCMNVFDALDTKFHFVNPSAKETSIGYYPVLKLAPTLWWEAQKNYQEHKKSESKTIVCTSISIANEGLFHTGRQRHSIEI